MKTNLIQNYINSTPMCSSPKQPSEKKTAPNFSIEDQLNNRTFIKPLKSKGKLVKSGLFDMPASFIKSSYYNLKSLKHGINGTANDHELGKLNDIGLVAGGIGIASYLYSRRTTPKTKAMEFVGLGTFLASMAIWPKIAISWPARLIHGFNVDQQYEDSFGRKKPFNLDPQFRPWDLYSDKEIDKIGDRLNVPRDINNRRDVIQQKMGKIAVQSNTLWMLTAGFAAPIMSGLMCNLLEKPIEKFQNDRLNQKAKDLLINFGNHVSKAKNDDILNKINQIIESNKEARIDEKIFSEISSALTGSLDPISSAAFEKDLKQVLMTDDFTFYNTSAKELNKNIKKVLSSEYSEKFAEIITPSEKDFIECMKKNNLMESSNNIDRQKDLIEILFEPVKNKISAYNEKLPQGAQAISEDEIGEIRGVLVSQYKKNNPFKQTFVKGNKSILNQDAQAALRNLANIMGDFNAQRSVLDEYAYMKVASAPETNIAHNWQTHAKAMFEALQIPEKDFNKARFDREIMGNVLKDRLAQICSNDELYKKTMKNMVEIVSKLDNDINVDKLYEEKVNSVYSEFAQKFASKDHPMQNFIRAIDGAVEHNGVKEQYSTSLKEISKEFVNNRLLGVKSSFYRLITTMDLYRRFSTQTTNSVLNDPKVPREIKEEVAELCQYIMTEGHSSDFASKFFWLRNPNPNLVDKSPVEFQNGKLVRKYGIDMAERVDIPNDCTFFQKTMDVLFAENMHPDTVKLLEENNLDEVIKTYRSRMYKEVGGDSYFAKPFHMPSQSAWSTSKTRFLLTGIAPDEFFHKLGKSTYNTKKWLKIFGGFGAGLLAVTIGSQFFFGKIMYPKSNKKAAS